MNSSSAEKTPSTSALAPMLEHTILSDDIDEDRLLAHCDEALELNLLGVCIPLAWVARAKKHCGDACKIITVIDFPLGHKSAAEKVLEARMAQALGADEIDMVIDYDALIQKNYTKALEDCSAVVEAVAPTVVKVIVETSALTHDQLVAAISLVALSKAAFIKTSTGFHQAGAQVSDIKLMRELLPAGTRIKASGGIRDFASAQAMVNAGATRIGASRSREILQK